MIRQIQAFVATMVLAAAVAQAEPPNLKLDISAQSMSDALNEFARQSGLQVVIDWKDSTGITAPPVQGTMTREEGLRKLLESSGLEFEFINARTVAVRGKGGEGRKTGRVAEQRSDAIRVAQIDQKIDSGRESQDASTGESEAEKVALEEIVVTGTHIKGAAPAGSPVIVLDRDTIRRSGYTSTEQLIHSLPQNIRSGAEGATADGRFGATTGRNQSRGSGANLRGLGSTAIPNPNGPAGSVPGLIAFTTGSMISALRTHSQAIDSWVSAGPPCVRAYEHVSLTRT